MTSALIARLRSDLATANFSVSALTGLWGIDADAALRRNQRVPALRALDGLRETLGHTEPCSTLARLFVLGLPVDRADLDAALPALGAAGAEELGLAASVVAVREPDASGAVRPLLELRPYSFVDAHGAGSWWILSDLGELALGHPLGESHVLGVGGASLTLSGLLIPTPVESALDLGTGCGIQAMHASRHADRVVATDISARALELAALNAQLNEIGNIEFRIGSLFDPVAGERFDHIISNPPFVITPRVPGVPAYEYRDGGLVGDALVEAVVRGAAEHLTPGGVAQLLGNWEYHAGQDAFERLAGWLDAPASGQDPAPTPDASPTTDAAALDAWIIEREVQAPTLYAETWIRDGGTRADTADFDRLYGAWLDDFEARGVSQVGFGYMLLRRPVAGVPTLRRLERLPGALGHNPGGMGSHLAACLAAHDWHAATDDARLARARLTVASDVTEERHYWPGQEDPTLMTLHQGGGFGRSISLDTGLAALVGACDDELEVGSIVAALAQLLDVDERELAADLLPRVRELLDDGFLQHPLD
ncbi:MAG TPA: methyltransferase [Cryobacterium sp.]|nr:methyltransferase [Cryobacterium sp.]